MTQDNPQANAKYSHRKSFFWKAAVAAFCLTLSFLCNGPAAATDRLRFAVQKTGTFRWELAMIESLGLARKADLDIVITELASPEAGKIALRGGSADIILSDWLWVSRERSLGGKLVFVPYSSAIGAVMVPQASPIHALADLKAKTLAVAGGPLDKSWLLLQAYAKLSNLDLKSETKIVYGAPALLAEKTAQGAADANLNYWNFCVALEGRGFRQLIGMDEVEQSLGAKGPVAMVGYVLDEKFAKEHADALQRFFKIAREAREALAHSDADWQRIAQEINVQDQAQLALYRQTYVKGFVTRPIAEEAEDARTLYRILAKIGGPDLVGDAAELDPGTFYHFADP
jgi:NitT/TauT family transport system substrate-binding protein